MARSNRKGDGREHEWAEERDGEKVSRRGYEGPDVVSPPWMIRNLSVWEVKSDEDLPLWFAGPDGWLGQMEREGADAVAFRQNRKPWYIIVRADKLEPQSGDSQFTDLELLQVLAEQVEELRARLQSALPEQQPPPE